MITRRSLGPRWPDPRRSNSLLDTCAFDPKYHPEDEAARRIQALREAHEVKVLLAHSNLKEIDHPNTPADVKAEASDMIHTISLPRNSQEAVTKAKIHEILAGNGDRDKVAADATHVFEAAKYMGYFITTDRRILAKGDALRAVSRAIVVTPSQWLYIFEEYAPG